LGVVHHHFHAGLAVVEVVAADPVHGRRGTCDDRQVVGIGERGHDGVDLERGPFREDVAQPRRRPVLHRLRHIFRLTSIHAHHHHRRLWPPIGPAIHGHLRPSPTPLRPPAPDARCGYRTIPPGFPPDRLFAPTLASGRTERGAGGGDGWDSLTTSRGTPGNPPEVPKLSGSAVLMAGRNGSLGSHPSTQGAPSGAPFAIARERSG